jgi:hypothetical protein
MTMKSLLLVIAVLATSVARATVHSYTLGIDVNCPSGLGE